MCLISQKKKEKDIIRIFQKQRGHSCFFDHGSGHQGSSAPEKLQTQNRSWAQQRDQEENGWSQMKVVTGKVYASLWKVFKPYMVSGPSQVDTYWSILLPLFGNYELEPKNQNIEFPLCLFRILTPCFLIFLDKHQIKQRLSAKKHKNFHMISSLHHHSNQTTGH